MPKAPILLATALGLLLVPSISGAPDLDGALVAEGTDVYKASFSWTGECNGAGTIAVTIHRPGGDESHEIGVQSVMVPDVCFPMTCMDCPPVPVPFTWTLTGAGVEITGGGVAAYEHYGYMEVLWSLRGPFQDGTLEVHGTIG